MEKKLNIAFVAPEVVPYAKTGGLADVAGALPKFFPEAGHTVKLFLPKYKKIDPKKFKLKKLQSKITFKIADRNEIASVFTTELVSGVTVYFIDNSAYFNRDELYGERGKDYQDNDLRFSFFAKAVLELCKRMDFQPDIFHCHDWQTGLIPTYLKTLYREDPFFADSATLFTIHNLAYQGLFPPESLSALGLGRDVYTSDTLEYYGKVSFIKGGLVFSELLNTVSQKYSREIQTEEYGCGLEGLLAARKQDLFGVVNGIDYDDWNPETDPMIAGNYSVADLAGKSFCKKELQDEYQLPHKDLPLIGIVSRLADQKGFDLINEVIDEIMKMDLQLVLLGTGEPKYHEMFEEIKKKYPQKAGVALAFDAKLAQKIYAGSDLFLMPSRYEPCGLGQLISLRYGTVPIVRRTGGLYDTIINYDQKNGNGFAFTAYDSKELLQTIAKAIGVYADKKTWKRIQLRGMKADFSWHASAKKYLDLYRKAINIKRK